MRVVAAGGVGEVVNRVLEVVANPSKFHEYFNIAMDFPHIHGNGTSYWWIFAHEMGGIRP